MMSHVDQKWPRAGIDMLSEADLHEYLIISLSFERTQFTSATCSRHLKINGSNGSYKQS